MKIELSKEQIAMIVDGLSAGIDNCESENRATNDEEILEANEKTVEAATALIEYIQSYKEQMPQVAVEVKGGLVQNVYADADVDVEVYDLDVSDFPDEGEEDEAYDKEAELEELVKSPGWRRVW